MSPYSPGQLSSRPIAVGMVGSPRAVLDPGPFRQRAGRARWFVGIA
jgi:hypothetical protein